MAAIQYLVPGGGYANETATVQYLVPGTGYLNETVAVAVTGMGLAEDGLFFQPSTRRRRVTA